MLCDKSFQFKGLQSLMPQTKQKCLKFSKKEKTKKENTKKIKYIHKMQKGRILL